MLHVSVSVSPRSKPEVYVTKDNSPLGLRIVAPVVAASLVLLVWFAVAAAHSIPTTLLPDPGDVLQRLGRDLTSGRLWLPLWVTTLEALAGCALSALTAMPIAYLIAHSKLADAALSPYLAASQAIPAVAVAPLMVIWVGYGMLPVVLLCSVMVFFPMVLSTVLGLRSIDKELLDAARVDGATAWQLACWMEWPLALPATLTGLRNGFTLSITGAVVGELVMGGSGLGQRLAVQSQSVDTIGLFSTLIVLSVLAVTIFLSMRLVEWLANPFASRRRLK
ncbi:hypothetical protein HMPREF1531_02116 [Propionibacterium sp. oral taxon 192 str. F0372]|nr:hypothetical protein HMPREF1531_02116 [Propionibacterium sp. oral taxon 192 str. F0372]